MNLAVWFPKLLVVLTNIVTMGMTGLDIWKDYDNRVVDSNKVLTELKSILSSIAEFNQATADYQNLIIQFAMQLLPEVVSGLNMFSFTGKKIIVDLPIGEVIQI